MEYSKQALWLRFLISEVFRSNLELTTSLLGQTTALSREQPFFIRWVIHNGSICLIYFMEDIIADTLTKPLSSTKAKHFAAVLGLRAGTRHADITIYILLIPFYDILHRVRRYYTFLLV
jgi:hypothetical protein